ncbi:putative nuclease HARBI1 [Trichomycterus rosablanca]|uniref:putative nuclease HARBI1 n=1 Tax=Trichomycterus rosablanca TaxID=2290929 RepID=UPI002F356B02
MACPFLQDPVDIEAQIIRRALHRKRINIITNVEAKWPGSVHHARIFHESALYNKFDQGQYDGLLVADRGYPCMPYVMTPYPDPEPGPQSRYNLALCRTRAKVEMTIGILKARFQCLRGLRVTPERACDIIVACVVLHNIATIRREQHPAIPQINDEEEPHLNVPEHRNGRIVRNSICNHYFSD